MEEVGVCREGSMQCIRVMIWLQFQLELRYLVHHGVYKQLHTPPAVGGSWSHHQMECSPYTAKLEPSSLKFFLSGVLPQQWKSH